MEESVGTFEPLRLPVPSDNDEVYEQKLWASFRPDHIKEEIGAVSHVEFCPKWPHRVAVTSSTRVLVYHTKTKRLVRTYARFKDKAHCSSFRADGKLIVAGGEDGMLQVFDTSSRTLLRRFQGHQQAVHVALFSQDRLHILSGGDDATVRYWDLASGEQLRRLDGHSDYVRAAAASPVSNTLWATGGYDHLCKVWNVETGQELLSLNHQSPVESLIYHPAGAMLISGGGTEVRVWHTLGRGHMVAKLDNFVKTVTCLQVYQMPELRTQGRTPVHLLTGSLDGNIRVFSMDNHKLVHINKQSGPVLSLAISPGGSHILAGLSNNAWTVRTRKLKTPRPVTTNPSARLAMGIVAMGKLAGKKKRGKSTVRIGATDIVVPCPTYKSLKPYDKRLRKFMYKDALDSALETGSAHIVGLLLEELTCRDGLRPALRGRDLESLARLLDFCARHITNARFSDTYIGAINRLLNIYSKQMGQLPAMRFVLMGLQQQIKSQLKELTAMRSMHGMLQPILAASPDGSECSAKDFF